MKLRLATVEDLPAICVLGRLMHEESTFAPMDYDIDRVKETVSDLMDKSQLVLVAEDTNGEVVGGILGKVTQSWFGNDLVANELGLFIHPDHRGGMLAARLVKTFVRWARMAGAKQIRPGVISGCDLAVGLYERLGFRNCGATFLMEGA
ncbi:GNAT family N-acetyltransferase [Quisquiliibacterium transsilvanicum]|uniref:L-amino acid N-acyltransferase YncA n=1 Tax=Quisquiliibacterium transsilvanicum TaxID=1549638 RepID=A0A7W8HHT1_9BURK|nr:GNAT family N-acetyltransferase [Quisquiliibacterium transsilvanicum]MBB5271553.1 L-amino acid N-acyltransferase YncA [Quisquiliibacterium transsilvanicum]